MFESILSKVLNSTVGQFLKDVSSDQLKFSMGGELTLKNVEVKPDAFDFLKLPVSIKAGKVGLLNVKLSWTGLTSTPVKVLVQDVSIVVGPGKDVPMAEAEAAAQLLKQKLEQLDNWELLNFPEKEIQEDSKGFLMRTVDTIVDHVTVQVDRVHVVFEGPNINLGVGIREVSVKPCDAQWNPVTKCIDTTVAGRRQIAVNDVCVYFNTPTQVDDASMRAALDSITHTSTNNDNKNSAAPGSALAQYNKNKSNTAPAAAATSTSKAVTGASGSTEPAPWPVPVPGSALPPVDYDYCSSLFTTMHEARWSYILPPTSMAAKLTMHKGSLESLQKLSPPAPAIGVEVHFTEIGLAIQKNQYQGLLLILAQLSHSPAALAMLERQQEETLAQLKLKTEIDAAKQEAMVTRGIQYADLYKRNFQGYPELAEADTELLKLMEKEEAMSTLLAWRAVALKVVQIEYAQDDKPFWRPKPSKGLFSGWFGPKGPAKPTKVADHALVRRMVLEPAAVQHEEEEKAMKNVNAKYVKIEVIARLDALSIKLMSPTRAPLLALAITGIGAEVRLRPSSTAVSAVVGAIEAVDHMTPGTVHEVFMRRSKRPAAAGRIGADRPLVSATVSLNDKAVNPDDGLDMKLGVELAAVDIIVNTGMLLQLAQFFEPPAEAKFMGEAKERAMARFNDVRGSMQSAAVAALENRGRNLMDVRVEAPTIIIPNDPNDINSHVLVVDLGLLTFKSAPPSMEEIKEQKVLLQKATKDPGVLAQLPVSDQLRCFYDNFHVSLTALTVYAGAPSFLFAPDASVFIVRPFEVFVGLHVCLINAAQSTADAAIAQRAPAAAASSKDSKKDKKDKKETAVVVAPAPSQQRHVVLNLPQTIISVSLPAIEVTVSPLKVARLLRLVKALLRTLKSDADAKAQAEAASKVVANGSSLTARINNELNAIEAAEANAAAAAEASTNSSSTALTVAGKNSADDSSAGEKTPAAPAVNPEAINIALDFKLGLICVTIANDLVPEFPVDVLSLAIKDIAVDFQMRPYDMSVKTALGGMFIEDCLHAFSPSTKYLMHTSTVPVTAYNSKFAPFAPAQSPLAQPGATLTAAFMAVQVDLVQRESPRYAYANTIVNAQFGKVNLAINRESLPALMFFFIKQLMPNKFIVNVEDATQGSAILDDEADAAAAGATKDAAAAKDAPAPAAGKKSAAATAATATSVGLEPDAGFAPSFDSPGYATSVDTSSVEVDIEAAAARSAYLEDSEFDTLYDRLYAGEDAELAALIAEDEAERARAQRRAAEREAQVDQLLAKLKNDTITSVELLLLHRRANLQVQTRLLALKDELANVERSGGGFDRRVELSGQIAALEELLQRRRARLLALRSRERVTKNDSRVFRVSSAVCDETQRVGVLAVPKNLSGRAVALDRALRSGDIPVSAKPGGAVSVPPSTAMLTGTERAVAPLFSAHDITEEKADEAGFKILSLSVLVAATFAGVTVTLNSRGTGVLGLAVTDFTTGFAQADSGMAVRAQLGAFTVSNLAVKKDVKATRDYVDLALRAPSLSPETIAAATAATAGATAGAAPSALRQASINPSASGKDALAGAAGELHAYVHHWFKAQSSAPKNASARVQRAYLNRATAKVEYPEIVYTSTTAAKALDTGFGDEDDEDNVAGNSKAGTALIDVSFYMRTPEPVVLDDLDEEEYFSFAHAIAVMRAGGIDEAARDVATARGLFFASSAPASSAALAIVPPRGHGLAAIREVATPRAAGTGSPASDGKSGDAFSFDPSPLPEPAPSGFENDYNVPALAVLTQGRAPRFAHSMVVRAKFSGLRVVACYKFVDSALAWAKDIDKVIAAVTAVPAAPAGVQTPADIAAAAVANSSKLHSKNSKAGSVAGSKKGSAVHSANGTPGAGANSVRRSSAGAALLGGAMSKTTNRDAFATPSAPARGLALPSNAPTGPVAAKPSTTALSAAESKPLMLISLSVDLEDIAVVIPASSTSPELLVLRLDGIHINNKVKLARASAVAKQAASAPGAANAFSGSATPVSAARALPSTRTGASFNAGTSFDGAAPAGASPSLNSRPSVALGRRPSALIRQLSSRAGLGGATPTLGARALSTQDDSDSDEFLEMEEGAFSVSGALFVNQEDYFHSLPTSAQPDLANRVIATTPSRTLINTPSTASGAAPAKRETPASVVGATIDYCSLQVQYNVHISGLSLASVCYLDQHGGREQSAAPRVSPSTFLRKIDLLQLSAVLLSATQHVYAPMLSIADSVLARARVEEEARAAKVPLSALMAARTGLYITQHTHQPPLDLPDWAVQAGLPDLNVILSQPHMSLALSLMADDGRFKGLLNERTDLTFPKYAPPTASSPREWARVIRYSKAAAAAAQASKSGFRASLVMGRPTLHARAGAKANDSAPGAPAAAPAVSNNRRATDADVAALMLARSSGPAVTNSVTRTRLNSKLHNGGSVAGSKKGSALGSRIASAIGSRLGSRRGSVNDDAWGLNKAAEMTGPVAASKPISFAVQFELTQLALQLVTDPSKASSASIALTLGLYTNANMKSDGALRVLAEVSDICMVNAVLSSANPEKLRSEIAALPVTAAIIKPFSVVVEMAQTASPVPAAIIRPSPAVVGATGDYGGVRSSDHAVAVPAKQRLSAFVGLTDIDVKLSYNDYELVFAVIGTLSMPPAAPTAVTDNAPAPENGAAAAADAAPAAEPAAPAPAPAPAPADTGLMKYTYGDMSVKVVLNNVSLLLVNDAPGFPLPFARFGVSDVCVGLEAFGHKRVITVKSRVFGDFHNGSLVQWEPLMEPTTFEIELAECVTLPMRVSVRSVGKMNFNITRAMMDGLAQSLELLSAAQKAQMKRIRARQRQLRSSVSSTSRGSTNGSIINDQSVLDVMSSTASSSSAASGGFSFFRLNNGTELPVKYCFGILPSDAGAAAATSMSNARGITDRSSSLSLRHKLRASARFNRVAHMPRALKELAHILTEEEMLRHDGGYLPCTQEASEFVHVAAAELAPAASKEAQAAAKAEAAKAAEDDGKVDRRAENKLLFRWLVWRYVASERLRKEREVQNYTKTLERYSACPLFFDDDILSKMTGTIGDNMRAFADIEDDEAAAAAAEEMGIVHKTRAQRLAEMEEAERVSRREAAYRPFKRLINLQVDGYLPLTNVAVDSVGSRMYQLLPGPLMIRSASARHVGETPFDPATLVRSIVLDVSIINGVKCVSLHTTTAVVNLTDTPLIFDGATLMPGQHHFLPMTYRVQGFSVQPASKAEPTLASATHSPSPVVPFSALVTGKTIQCAPTVAGDAPFTAVVQSWARQGCIYWALTAPIAVTNMLSEAAVVQVTALPGKTANKLAAQAVEAQKQARAAGTTTGAAASPASSAPARSGMSDYSVADSKLTGVSLASTSALIAPTHAMRSYLAAPLLTSPAETTTDKDGNAVPFSKEDAPVFALSVKIPGIGVSWSEPLVIDKKGSKTLTLRCRDRAGRAMLVYAEVSYAPFLTAKRGAARAHVPNIYTSEQQASPSAAMADNSGLISSCDISAAVAAGHGVVTAATYAAVKVVLYAPYWIFDSSNLGVIVSETREDTAERLCLTQAQLVDAGVDPQERVLRRLRTALTEQGKQDGAESTTVVDPATAAANVFQLAAAGGAETAAEVVEDRCWARAVMFSPAKLVEGTSTQVYCRLAKPLDQRRADAQAQGKVTSFATEWSDKMSLDAVGAMTLLTLTSMTQHTYPAAPRVQDQTTYQVSALIRNGTGAFRRTKFIYFAPRFVIVNRLPLPVLLRQHHVEDQSALKMQVAEAAALRASAQADEEEKNAENGNGWLVARGEGDASAEGKAAALEARKEARALITQDIAYHVAACSSTTDSTELYLRHGEVDAWHYPYSKQKRLVAFRMLTPEDSAAEAIDEAVTAREQAELARIKRTAIEAASAARAAKKSRAGVRFDSDDDDDDEGGADEDEVDEETVDADVDTVDATELRTALPHYIPERDGSGVMSARRAVDKAEVTAAAKEAARKSAAAGKGKGKGKKSRKGKGKADAVSAAKPWEEGEWGWSGFIDLDKVGESTLTLRNTATHQSFMANVRILMSGPDVRGATGNSVTIVLEPQSLVFPRYRIENRTSCDTFRFTQSGSQDWTTLAPYETAVYTWDQPLGEKELEVSILSGLQTINKKFSLEEARSLGRVTVPGSVEANALVEMTSAATATSMSAVGTSNGSSVGAQRSTVSSLVMQSAVVTTQTGGMNPILSATSQRATHDVFVSVVAEGPTRVLVLSDFPLPETSVDLVTHQLLRTPAARAGVLAAADKYSIGLRGSDSLNIAEARQQARSQSGRSGEGLALADDEAALHPYSAQAKRARLAAAIDPLTGANLAELYDGIDLWAGRTDDVDTEFHDEDDDAAAARKEADIDALIWDAGVDALDGLSAADTVVMVRLRAQAVAALKEDHARVEAQKALVAQLAALQQLNSNNANNVDSGVSATPARVATHLQPLCVSDVAYLCVRVVEARWLTAGGMDGLSDCYAVLTLHNQSYKTDIAAHTLNPYWNNELFFKLDGDLLAAIRRSAAEAEAAAEEAEADGEVSLALSEKAFSTLNKAALKIAVFHKNKVTSDTFLGGVIVGNLSCIARGQAAYDAARVAAMYSAAGVQSAASSKITAGVTGLLGARGGSDSGKKSGAVAFGLGAVPEGDEDDLDADEDHEEGKDGNDHKHEKKGKGKGKSVTIAAPAKKTEKPTPLPAAHIADVFDEVSETSDDPWDMCPVKFMTRWLQLHAVRQNKRLHGQLNIAIGFAPNELTRQALILHELQADLAHQVSLLAQLTEKFASQLRDLDVGKIDLNTLQILADEATVNAAIAGMGSSSVGNNTSSSLGTVAPSSAGLSVVFEADENAASSSSLASARGSSNAANASANAKAAEKPKKKGGFFSCCSSSSAADEPDAPAPRSSNAAAASNNNSSGALVPSNSGSMQPRRGTANNASTAAAPAPKLSSGAVKKAQQHLDALIKSLALAAEKRRADAAKLRQEYVLTVRLQSVQVSQEHILGCLRDAGKTLSKAWRPVKVRGLVQCNGHTQLIDLFEIQLTNSGVAALEDARGRRDINKIAADAAVSGSGATSRMGALMRIASLHPNLGGVGSQLPLTLVPCTGVMPGSIVIKRNLIDELDDEDPNNPSTSTHNPSSPVAADGASAEGAVANSSSLTPASAAPASPTAGSAAAADAAKKAEDKNKEKTAVLPPGTRGVELVPEGESIELTFTVPLSLVQPALRAMANEEVPSSAAVLSLHILTETVRELPNSAAAKATAAATAADASAASPSGTTGEPETPSGEQRAMATAATIAGVGLTTGTASVAHLPFSTETAFVSCGEVLIPLHTVALATTPEEDAAAAAKAAAATAAAAKKAKAGELVQETLVFDALMRDSRTLLPGPTWHFAVEDSSLSPRNAKALSRVGLASELTPAPVPYTAPPVMGVTKEDIERAFKEAKMKAKASDSTGSLRLHTGLEGVQASLALQKANAQNLRRVSEGAPSAISMSSLMSSSMLPAESTQLEAALAATKAKADAAVSAAAALALPVAPVRVLATCQLTMAKPLIDRESMEVRLAVDHVGLSLVDSANAGGGGASEVLYISIEGVVVSLTDSIATSAIELSVQAMQVDHQSSIVTAGPDAEAIVFGPSEDAIASGKPFIHIGLSRTKTAADYPVQVFKYATVLVQEIEVTIDESLIWQLLSVVNDILPRLVSEPDPTQYMLLDKRNMYHAEGHSSAAQFYFSLLHIQPLQLYLTFRANPDLRVGSEAMAFNPIQAVFNAASGVLGSIDAAPVCLNSLIVQDAYGDVATLLQPIVQFYVTQGIGQGYKILGSVEFLGNPVSLVSGVGAGVKDFFYAPAQGLVSSPKDFGTGIAKGSASLITSVTTGVFGAAAKITGSAGSGVAALTMDAEFQAKRRARGRKQVKHAGDGLLEGAKSLGHGIFSGLKGIVADPLKGARQGGVGGFFKGLGKGLTGVVTKTASGAVDMVTTTLKGVGATFSLLGALGEDEIVRTRRRLPRFIANNGALTVFQERDALAQYVIHQVPPPEEDECDVVDAYEVTGLTRSLGLGITENLGISETTVKALEDGDNDDLAATLRALELEITSATGTEADKTLGKKKKDLLTKMRRYRAKMERERVLLAFPLRTTSDVSDKAANDENEMSDSDLLVVVTDVRVLVVHARAAARMLAREGSGSSSNEAAKRFVRANVRLARMVDVFPQEVPGKNKKSPMQTRVVLSMLGKGTGSSADTDLSKRHFPARSLADAKLCALRMRALMSSSRVIQAHYGTRGAWYDVTYALAEQLALSPRGNTVVPNSTKDDRTSVTKSKSQQPAAAAAASSEEEDVDNDSGETAATYPVDTFRPSRWVKTLRRPRSSGDKDKGKVTVVNTPPATVASVLSSEAASRYASEREWYNKLVMLPGHLPDRVKLLVVTFKRGNEIIVKTMVQGETVVLI